IGADAPDHFPQIVAGSPKRTDDGNPTPDRGLNRDEFADMLETKPNCPKSGLKILGRLSVILCCLNLFPYEGNAFHGEGVGRSTQWTILRIMIARVIWQSERRSKQVD